VRRALDGAPPGPIPEPATGYRGAGDSAIADAVGLFAENIADYRANVHRVEAEGVDALLAERCAALGAKRLGAPAGAPWRVDGVELVTDDPPLSTQDLDGLDGVISGCALAIAQTGTIVLDGAGLSGRRALTLVPDLHLCVVHAEQVVPAVPDAIAALQEAAEDGRPMTLVSGPSATSDIELNRVEGVHGPRTLEVLVVG
jgi:L-lactate dehydrogenase complex protein LldG